MGGKMKLYILMDSSVVDSPVVVGVFATQQDALQEVDLRTEDWRHDADDDHWLGEVELGIYYPIDDIEWQSIQKVRGEL
jgi:hypothetical protein